MAEKLFPQYEDPDMENLLIDDHSPEATGHPVYLTSLFQGTAGQHGTPDSNHANYRPLLMKRRLSGLEKSASGYTSLHRMDNDPHGFGYCPTYPSNGEIQPLSVPLMGYASSASFEGQEHGSCLSERSCPDNRYGYLSGAQSPGSTSLQSSVQYRGMVYSPAPDSLQGLYPNCHNSVSPRDVQHTPDLDYVPFESPCSTQLDGMTVQQPAFAGQAWDSSTGKGTDRYETASPAVSQAVVVDPALEDQTKYFRHPQPLHPPARWSPVALLSPTYPSHATSPPSSTAPLSPESHACNESQNHTQTVNTDVTVAKSGKHPGRKGLSSRGPRGRRSTSIAQRRRSTDKVIFECDFRPYGCHRTFSAKNEWKRHVSTIHLQLETFYCSFDGCGPSKSPMSSADSAVIPHLPSSHRPYNRKDLFTQHIRRMHAPWKQTYKPTVEEETAFEEEIKQIQNQSRVRRREPPQRSQCTFCEQEFVGPQCWDKRMEHACGHFENHDRQIREDGPLRDWAVQEGILKLKGRAWALTDPAGIRKRKS